MGGSLFFWGGGERLDCTQVLVYLTYFLELFSFFLPFFGVGGVGIRAM